MVIRILLPAVMLLTLVAALVGHNARAEALVENAEVPAETAPAPIIHVGEGVQLVNTQITFSAPVIELSESTDNSN